MLVGDLSAAQFCQRLAGHGIGVRIGPFDVAIVARMSGLAEPLHALYCYYPLLEGERVYSVHIELCDVLHLWPRPRRMARFIVDGRSPHPDMPAAHALCVLEWGINLVIAMRYQSLLMLHAAVVERNGGALLLPAEPGAGKTTLCAGLVARGWRLLSDEFGLVRPGSVQMLPVPRALPLKNESIEVIRRFAPNSHFGPVIPGTRKGTIAHLRAPRSSIERADEAATARWIVFPQWQAGVTQRLQPVSGAGAFALLATNAFNYELQGEAGFQTVSELIRSARCYRLEYSDLDSAVNQLTGLADQHAD